VIEKGSTIGKRLYHFPTFWKRLEMVCSYLKFRKVMERFEKGDIKEKVERRYQLVQLVQLVTTGQL